MATTPSAETAVRRRPRRARLAWGLALTALVPACAHTRGPDLVVNSHLAYNEAVSSVLKEELLLNVVRRRYQEALQFLDVSSITTTFTTRAGVQADVAVNDFSGSSSNDAGIGGSLEFTDSPTITITPRQGEDIATQLHEPIAPSTIADLAASGYEVQGLFDILSEGVNGLRGSDHSSSGFASPSADWNEALGLLGELMAEGQVVIDRFEYYDKYNDYAYPAASITPDMWITTLSTGDRRWKSFDGGETFFITTYEVRPGLWMAPETQQSPRGRRLLELLHLEPGVFRGVWFFKIARVVDGPDNRLQADVPREHLRMRMRSLYNVLNLFSYGVEVPPEHEAEGRVTDLTEYRQALGRGEARDYSSEIAIHWSSEYPEGAFQVVKYRDVWFYIDDTDLLAKASFNALYDLWQLSIKAPTSTPAPQNVIQVN